MNRKSSRLLGNLVLFIATMVATGCGQFNKEGKFNPGGCDGPNSYDVDAAPSTSDALGYFASSK